MDLRDLHFKLEYYDQGKEDIEKKWDEIHKLKPDNMNELEFQDLIQQARLNNKLIKSFEKNEMLECKHLIYRGASKQFLYDYVSTDLRHVVTKQQACLLQDLRNIKREKNYPYTYDREISDPRIIKKEEYDRLLEKLDKKEEFSFDEQDRYLLEDGDIYITIDNTSSEMFVEEFKSRDKAVRYLQGESLDKLRDEECIYEVCIYETEEDYNQGEPFQLHVYSDLNEAIRELESTINYNHYFSGKVINQENGNEEYNFYLNPERDRYGYIFECTLKSNNKKYEQQYLLVKGPNDLNSELAIDLKGDLYFNCEYEVLNSRLIKTVENMQDLINFCDEYNIRLPKECVKKDGIIAGGPNGLYINNQLEPVDWLENLEKEDEECM